MNRLPISMHQVVMTHSTSCAYTVHCCWSCGDNIYTEIHYSAMLYTIIYIVITVVCYNNVYCSWSCASHMIRHDNVLSIVYDNNHIVSSLSFAPSP